MGKFGAYLVDCSDLPGASLRLWNSPKATSCLEKRPQHGDIVMLCADADAVGRDGFTLSPQEEALVVAVDADGDVQLRNGRGETSSTFWLRRHFMHSGSKAKSCADRAPKLGDMVCIAGSEAIVSRNGFSLALHEEAAVVNLDADRDLKLRDPHGNVSEHFWSRDAFNFTRAKELSPHRIPSGVLVIGYADDGGEWLHMGDMSLPFRMHGLQVLKEVADAKMYLVDNSALNSKSAGLNYRLRPSARPEDKSHRLLVPYGSVVGGVPLDDEWLQVGEYYLPFTVQGAVVVREADVQMEELTPALLGDLQLDTMVPTEGAVAARRHLLKQRLVPYLPPLRPVPYLDACPAAKGYLPQLDPMQPPEVDIFSVQPDPAHRLSELATNSSKDVKQAAPATPYLAENITDETPANPVASATPYLAQLAPSGRRPTLPMRPLPCAQPARPLPYMQFDEREKGVVPYLAGGDPDEEIVGCEVMKSHATTNLENSSSLSTFGDAFDHSSVESDVDSSESAGKKMLQDASEKAVALPYLAAKARTVPYVVSDAA